MPAITASLSEIGYEGYASIPKGMRSKVIDELLRDYALKRVRINMGPDIGAISAQQVNDNLQKMQLTLETAYAENKTLKEELKKKSGKSLIAEQNDFLKGLKE